MSDQIASLFTKAKENGFAEIVIEDSAITSARTKEEKYTFDGVASKKNSYEWPTLRCSYSTQYNQKSTKYSIEELKCLYLKKCQKSTQKKSNNKGIEPKSSRSFSDIFKNALGKKNVENIQRIDDIDLEESIFIAFIEKEALRQYSNNEKLLSFFKVNCKELCISYRIKNNTLFWKLRFGDEESTGFIAYISALFTIPYIDAIATLANILGVNINYLFPVYSVETRVAETKIDDFLIDNLLTHCRVANAGHLELQNQIEVKGYSNQTIGAFLLYQLDSLDFVLPACVVRGKLTMGVHKSPAYLLNQEKFDKNKDAIVFFCQDIRLAIALDRFVQESKFVTAAEVVVTGHIGGDLSVIDWNYFYRRNVIFIIAPNKESFSQVDEYKNYFEKSHVKSFGIYPYPVLRSRLLKKLSEEELDQCPLIERELYANCIIIDDEESPFRLIGEISKGAISYEDFLDWGRGLDLFKGKKSVKDDKNIISPVFDFSSEVPIQQKSFEELSFWDIIPSITMLHAPKDTGKSLCALSIAVGVSMGCSSFGFRLSNERVITATLDSETPANVLGQRALQLEVKNECFITISKVNMQDDLWGRFDLLNDEHRNELENLLKKEKVGLLILDNLTSLIETGSIYTPETARTIMTWVASLKEKGIAVVIVHHTLEEGKPEAKNNKMRGSDEWRIRCQTEIQLINKHEALAMKNLPSEVHDSCKEDGATIGMFFKSCKSAPVVTDKIVWLHLGLGDRDWKRLCVTDREGDLLSFPSKLRNDLGVIHHEVDCGVEEIELQIDDLDFYSDLSDDEQKIFQLAKGKTSFMRKDIDSLLVCKDSKSNILLKSLVEKEIIERIGEGKSTTYKLLQGVRE